MFENRGAEIGVTLHHPHGQIYAYPYVTPRTKSLLASIASYGPALMGDILEFEAKSERVLIARRALHRVRAVRRALADRGPPAAAPARPRPGRDHRRRSATRSRCSTGGSCARSTGSTTRPTPYIAAWHQAPVHAGRDDIRLMLQVTSPRRAADKLKFPAGSETGMGAFIGDIKPEAAAARLRDALEPGAHPEA